MRSVLTAALLVAAVVSGAAQFPPDGGRAGSTAIAVGDVAWAGWASSLTVVPGALDIARPELGDVGRVADTEGLGAPDARTISLGDGGVVTLAFDITIGDGAGADFVVFENGFPVDDSTGFHELAFVEVSSDGERFVRFPTTSLTETAVGPFGTLAPTHVDGFAGKYSAPYGVPFDLADLPDDPALDRSAVTHVRLIDVVGTPDSAFASFDSDGTVVYDPYPTDFSTGGFDLDAVGVLHAGRPTSTSQARANEASSTLRGVVLERGVWPTGFCESCSLYTLTGKPVHTLPGTPIASGSYIALQAPAKVPQEASAVRLLIFVP